MLVSYLYYFITLCLQYLYRIMLHFSITNHIKLKTMKKVLITFLVALFATVVLGQTKTAIKSSDLPKCVHEYLAKNMKGFNIDKAFRMDNKGEILYLVIILKGKEKHSLEFDRMCQNVKKVTVTEPKKEAVPPPPPKPVPLPVKAKDKHPLPPSK